jgi:uncharacterized protein YyaL (SSP411 family)
LVAKKIDLNDDVIPSANSTFAKCLLLLGYLFDGNSYHQMADNMILRIQHKVEKFPTGYSNWMQVMLMKQHGVYQLVCCGNEAREQLVDMNKIRMPNKLIVAMQQNNSNIPLLVDKQVTATQVFYLCKDKTCGLPQPNLGNIIKEMLKH